MDIPRPPVRRTGRHVAYALLIAVAVAAASAGLRRLRARAPAVDRSAIWPDTVRRGPMVREVLGQGTLVPEEIRWIAARSAARVERVLVKAGAVVTADTVILELGNSDLELQALEADRQLAQAQAELARLQATLSSQRLAQESQVATIASELADARRRARADEALAARGFLSELEQGHTLGRATELTGRLEFEQRRLRAQSQAIPAQLAAHRAQVDRLRSIAGFRRREVAELRLRAGVDGVLQELSLQPGQAVAGGALLAKVAKPDRLKAEVRIPETQAKDVHVGCRATIDTRNGVVPGRVVRIDPAAQAGTVLVDVALDGPAPPGARPDLNVEGTIELERLPSVLHVGRPSTGQPGSTIGLFRIERDGIHAERVPVKLGRSSARSIEVVAGLAEGDRVILSDMSQWDAVDRIRLE
jgi:multidrug resistance efflux pump